ncbi:P-loop containing nucleoside triphosphate hydrolase protein, partial [Lineolata rhizophorae]
KSRKDMRTDGNTDDEPKKKHRALMEKFQKATDRAKVPVTTEKGEVRPEVQGSDKQMEDSVNVSKVHGLEELPQFPVLSEKAYVPQFSALPTWITEATEVDGITKVPFSLIGAISPTLQERLRRMRYAEAFAVQATIIPKLVRPSFHHYHRDMCVAAPTGSGKTLSYLLPIIQMLWNAVTVKLRAVIVVPTRELALQVWREARKLAGGSNIRLGLASGSCEFEVEKGNLMEQTLIYDEELFNAMQAAADKERADAIRTGFWARAELAAMKDAVPHWVPTWKPAVDILICTPGRLVEHLIKTPGFDLFDLRWLVIDEADKLLEQSYQRWVDVVIGALERPKPRHRQDYHEKLEESESIHVDRTVQKIILSATMTRDLAKLHQLRLQCPKLVVVKENQAEIAGGGGHGYELPAGLVERGVHVGSGNLKPVHLLHLLRTEALETHLRSSYPDRSAGTRTADNASHFKRNTHHGREDRGNSVLIFTKNNESAMRLAFLLKKLHPPFSRQIGLLEKSEGKKNEKTLKKFNHGVYSILIASDRASRGLDIPELGHIINYDIPNEVVKYVHRAGRTARAGRQGHAWTLVADTEAAYFWKDIVKGGYINRGQRSVTRMTIPETMFDVDMLKKYEDALREL